MIQYKSWCAFMVAGRKFLALEMKDSRRGFHVYGEGFRNYGAWMAIETFRKRFKAEGEALALD